jgi:tartrate-resistant acid phosphatase type 5
MANKYSWRVFVVLAIFGLILLLSCSLLSQPLSAQTTATSAQLTPPTLQFIPSAPPLDPSATVTTASLPTSTFIPSATPTPGGVSFAVIGDYGEGNQAEADVANLIQSWSVDFIITVGDNNYPTGSHDTIDAHIGQFYHSYIYPYHGGFGPGAEKPLFFPTLGNHDWDSGRAQAYLDYFELPGNERYYDFIQGPVHFFALDTDSREPDGVGRSSIQAQWLHDQLAASTSTWNVVYGHHPPYTSGVRGPVDWMRWPFKEWGATVYLCGHDHFYERLEVDGMLYIIDGLGGGPIYDFGLTGQGSQFRYNKDYGALLVRADESQITFQFINRSGQILDASQLVR